MPNGSTINENVYLDILKNKLPSFMSIYGTSYLQQDRAPGHTAKQVTMWLVDAGFHILGPWPFNSPDLNPIENLWSKMKTEVSNKNQNPPRTDRLY